MNFETDNRTFFVLE